MQTKTLDANTVVIHKLYTNTSDTDIRPRY